ncbi:hypothetical protein SNEBB_004968 [Seison nebaliae]|nr:hypothetical protein SNEBB_004968 [Seison nebaliae]
MNFVLEPPKKLSLKDSQNYITHLSSQLMVRDNLMRIKAIKYSSDFIHLNPYPSLINTLFVKIVDIFVEGNPNLCAHICNELQRCSSHLNCVVRVSDSLYKIIDLTMWNSVEVRMLTLRFLGILSQTLAKDNPLALNVILKVVEECRESDLLMVALDVCDEFCQNSVSFVHPFLKVISKRLSTEILEEDIRCQMISKFVHTIYLSDELEKKEMKNFCEQFCYFDSVAKESQFEEIGMIVSTTICKNSSDEIYYLISRFLKKLKMDNSQKIISVIYSCILKLLELKIADNDSVRMKENRELIEKLWNEKLLPSNSTNLMKFILITNEWNKVNAPIRYLPSVYIRTIINGNELNEVSYEFDAHLKVLLLSIGLLSKSSFTILSTLKNFSNVMKNYFQLFHNDNIEGFNSLNYHLLKVNLKILFFFVLNKLESNLDKKKVILFAEEFLIQILNELKNGENLNKFNILFISDFLRQFSFIPMDFINLGIIIELWNELEILSYKCLCDSSKSTSHCVTQINLHFFRLLLNCRNDLDEEFDRRWIIEKSDRNRKNGSKNNMNIILIDYFEIALHLLKKNFSRMAIYLLSRIRHFLQCSRYETIPFWLCSFELYCYRRHRLIQFLQRKQFKMFIDINHLKPNCMTSIECQFYEFMKFTRLDHRRILKLANIDYDRTLLSILPTSKEYRNEKNYFAQLSKKKVEEEKEENENNDDMEEEDDNGENFVTSSTKSKFRCSEKCQFQIFVEIFILHENFDGHLSLLIKSVEELMDMCKNIKENYEIIPKILNCKLLIKFLQNSVVGNVSKRFQGSRIFRKLSCLFSIGFDWLNVSQLFSNISLVHKYYDNQLLKKSQSMSLKISKKTLEEIFQFYQVKNCEEVQEKFIIELNSYKSKLETCLISSLRSPLYLLALPTIVELSICHRSEPTLRRSLNYTIKNFMNQLIELNRTEIRLFLNDHKLTDFGNLREIEEKKYSMNEINQKIEEINNKRCLEFFEKHLMLIRYDRSVTCVIEENILNNKNIDVDKIRFNFSLFYNNSSTNDNYELIDQWSIDRLLKNEENQLKYGKVELSFNVLKSHFKHIRKQMKIDYSIEKYSLVEIVSFIYLNVYRNSEISWTDCNFIFPCYYMTLFVDLPDVMRTVEGEMKIQFTDISINNQFVSEEMTQEHFPPIQVENELIKQWKSTTAINSKMHLLYQIFLTNLPLYLSCLEK